IIANEKQLNPNFEIFRNMMLFAYGRQFAKMRKISDETGKIGRENIKQLLLYGLKISRMCNYQSLNNYELVKASGAELDFIQKFSKFVNYNNIDEISKVLNDAVYHISRNVNTKIVIMDTLLKISGILYHKK
ncbi:MAG: hypothetical protein DRI86_08025, partial [Bacteroidetes bacterium]